MQSKVKEWLRAYWLYVLIAVVVSVFELAVKAGVFPPDRFLDCVYDFSCHIAR